jgi:hypothetical protein
MSQLQKSIDLAHDIRERLPHLSVYIEQPENEEFYPTVWISQTAAPHWFMNKDVVSVFSSNADYLCKQYRILGGYNA